MMARISGNAIEKVRLAERAIEAVSKTESYTEYELESASCDKG